MLSGALLLGIAATQAHAALRHIEGTVLSKNSNAKTFKISTQGGSKVTIRVNANTKFQRIAGNFSGLRQGMAVEVEAQSTSSGLLAKHADQVLVRHRDKRYARLSADPGPGASRIDRSLVPAPATSTLPRRSPPTSRTRPATTRCWWRRWSWSTATRSTPSSPPGTARSTSSSTMPVRGDSRPVDRDLVEPRRQGRRRFRTPPRWGAPDQLPGGNVRRGGLRRGEEKGGSQSRCQNSSGPTASLP